MAKNYSHAGHSGMTSDDDIAARLDLWLQILGGVRYFQPESDQYAVAATLYAMICDRPPVQFTRGGNPLMELRRHQVPRIESLAPNIPSNLASWIHRGLTPDPPIDLDQSTEMRQQLRSIYKEFEKKTQ